MVLIVFMFLDAVAQLIVGRMRKLSVLFFVVFLTSCASSRNSRITEQSTEDVLWFWSADNVGGHKMKIQVLLDKVVLYEKIVPIVHARRSSVRAGKPIEFNFSAPRAILWQGYKEDETTPPGHRITCRIWRAGSDPDKLILGVWFGGKDESHMNTLCIAYPDRAEATEIASGLVVATTPISEGTPASKPSIIPRSTGSVLDELEH